MEPLPARSSCASTPAARRRTPRRTRTVAMVPKATMADARKTSRLRIRLSPNTSSRRSKTASMRSDPEIHHAVHHEIADRHPQTRKPEPDLGDPLVPDAAVEIRRDHAEQKENGDRQPGQEKGGELPFGGERLDFSPHLEALADGRGQVLQNLAQV